MQQANQDPGCSRRRFVEKLAQGSLLAGAAAWASSPLLAAEANPFAYDVSRFSRTDPALLRWEEVSRRVCPGKGHRRLAFGPDDVLHVAAGPQVIRLGAGNPLSPLEVGATVNCIAVAEDGTAYVGLRDHIEVFDRDGQRRAAWAKPDPRTWFSSLALGPDVLFAADSGNRVILRYDRAGNVRGRIGTKDAARHVPGLIVPSPFLDVKLHPDGLLRVNNPGRHRFEAYTVDGDFESAWGKPTASIAGFCGCCNPIALAVLPDGRVVTAEKGLPRVKVYRADGELESVAAGTESFAANAKTGAGPGDSAQRGLDVAVDARGRIHVLDRVTAEIRILQPKKGAA